MSLACCNALAADGTGIESGVIFRQLERTDRVHEYIERTAPIIEKENKKPDTEKLHPGKKILVKRFRLEGNTQISEKELLSDVTLADGKELTLEEITNVADMITTKYRNKGFLIVNAYVPSQSIYGGAVITRKNNSFQSVNTFGTVVIRVVEGKVGNISVNGNKYYSSSFIEKRLENVRNDPSLKEQTLEKDLIFLNEYPGLSVKATLKAGKAPGTTDIFASATDSYPVSGTVSFDNFGVKSTSKNRLVASLNIGNTATSGDQISLSGMVGLDGMDLSRLSYGRAEYSLPVGLAGTQIGTYYSNTIYSASGDESLTPLELKGKAHVFGLYATYPLIRKLNRTVNLKFGGEYITLYDNVLGSTKDTDEIRKISIGISHELTDNYKGKNIFGFGYARGLGGFLNGTKSGAINPNPSYLGADDSFNKFNIEAMRVQKLPGDNQLVARASFQYSQDRLFSAERMQVGGEGSVRGVNPGTLSGDSGYFGSLELLVAPFSSGTVVYNQKISEIVKLAFFTDLAKAINSSPRPTEISSATISNIGVGIRLYAGTRFTSKLDLVIPSLNGIYNSLNLNDSQIMFQTMFLF